MAAPFQKAARTETESVFSRWNRQLARLRVEVEHVLAGVKRCRMVFDPLRHWKAGFADAVMEFACGLHTLLERYRRPATA